MFFEPKYFNKKGDNILHLSKKTKILNSNLVFSDYINNSLSEKEECNDYLETVNFIEEIPEEIIDEIKKNAEYKNSKEEFVLIVDGKNATVYGNCDRALLFGFTQLQQLNITNEITDMFLYDYPLCSVRGYRAFLPGRNNISVFKKVVDMLAFYRYSCIVLEIGGAMEYKKHPEINEKWIEFSKEIHSKPGRADEIQHKTYPWGKNSIHCDNGDGSFLTQDECREILKYCNDRCIEVVPECPTMSHCDYLCIAHPEIAERANDAYPDTYCPNNPKTYPLVFDVLGEVIDVFKPRHIHIGHDEMYSVSVCDKCKDHDPVMLYVNDIKKIHDFLKEKNIGTWMWGEKLLDARTADGQPIGGAGYSFERNGGTCKVNALYPCRDYLPDDITFLHWYWSFDINYDKIYHERHYKMVFGNLSALDLKHWKMRVKWGADGGFCSNWGSYLEEYMQRNFQYISLLGNALAFWSPDFDDDTSDKYLDICYKELFKLKLMNTKCPIFIEHTTSGHIKWKSFYDGVFIEKSKYLIGNYEISYSDGSTALLPVTYGTHLSCAKCKEGLGNCNVEQANYTTIPKLYGDSIYYLAVYENPCPDKVISGIKYIPVADKADEFPVYIKSIKLPTPDDFSVVQKNEHLDTASAFNI